MSFPIPPYYRFITTDTWGVLVEGLSPEAETAGRHLLLQLLVDLQPHVADASHTLPQLVQV